VLLACGYCLSAKHLRLLVCFSTVPTRDSTGQFEAYSSPHFLLSEVQIFSNHFRSLVAYLVDLCGRPVDRLDKEERQRVCAESEVRLARTIRRLQPQTVITVVRSISTNVERAQRRADWVGLHLSLPYPGRWHHHQVAFEESILPVLRRQLSEDRVHRHSVPPRQRWYAAIDP
jgi:hypothetical protein